MNSRVKHPVRLAPVLTAIALALAIGACSDPETEKAQRYERGQALADSGKYREAIIEFRKALQADPNFADAHLAVAQAYERTDDTVNAYRSYQRAADLRPDRAHVQITVARFLLDARQCTDARTRVERALAVEPGNAEAHMILGSALAGMRDVAGAIAQVQQAIDLAPDSTTGYTGMGSLLLTQGRTEEAQAQFTKAIEVDPASAEARVALGTYHWSTGETALAEKHLREGVTLQPDDATANHALALLLISTGRAGDAEPYLKALGRALDTPEAELPLADYYVRGGRIADARAILERTATTGNASAIVRLARLDFAEGQRDRAYRRIDTLLNRQPSNSEAIVAKGRWLLHDGKPGEALDLARVAIERDPGKTAAHLLAADARYALGEAAEASNDYRTVLRLNPRMAAANTALSRIQLAAGNADSSVEFARGALLDEPGRDEARVLLARGLLQRRDVKRASEEIAILTARRPDDPTILALQGTLKLTEGKLPAARALFEQALAKDAGHVEALTGLTTLDAADGQLARARERLAAALAKTPLNVRLLMLAARADLQAGDAAAGERRARAVIEIDDGHLNAYELLGASYIRQQKLESALAEFEQVVEKEPRSIGALTVIGMIHEASGRTHEAEKAYQRALIADPRASVAANNLAYILAERGDNLEYALVLARDAASVKPDDPVVLDTLGWVLLKKGQASQAVTPLLKAVRLASDNPIYHYHLGLAYAEAREPAKARAALQQALQLSANFPGADQARERLRTLD